jgi:TatA/E family protein of Tat protein translocase
MFNLGPFELVAIFVVALLVFGPDKLPEMGRQVGKAVREFRKFQAQMETNVRDVIDPITGPLTSNGGMGPQATNVRDSGTLGGGSPNVPRSATIQNPEQEGEGEGEGEGEDAAPPGSFGYYAPVDEPQAAPQNGPAPAGDETAAPPERPADPETR